MIIFHLAPSIGIAVCQGIFKDHMENKNKSILCFCIFNIHSLKTNLSWKFTNISKTVPSNFNLMSLRKFDIPKVLIAQKITGFTIAKEN